MMGRFKNILMAVIVFILVLYVVTYVVTGTDVASTIVGLLLPILSGFGVIVTAVDAFFSTKKD